MSKPGKFLSFILLLTLGTPLGAVGEFTKVNKITEKEKCILLGLEREIYSIEQDIQKYYPELHDDPCLAEEGGDPTTINCKFYRIDKQTNRVVIPLTSSLLSYYGRRDKYFLTEVGYIQWEGNRIVGVKFLQKYSQIGAGAIVKTLSSDVKVPEQEIVSLDTEECLAMSEEQRKSSMPSLNFFVKEIFPSGRGSIYTFRIPENKDMEVQTVSMLVEGKRRDVQVSYIRDKSETIEVEGKAEKVRVAYVRDFRTHIDMTREFLRMLKLMYRRIDWNSRGAHLRQIEEIQRILKSGH